MEGVVEDVLWVFEGLWDAVASVLEFEGVGGVVGIAEFALGDASEVDVFYNYLPSIRRLFFPCLIGRVIRYTLSSTRKNISPSERNIM